jgi:hypothetical protein
MEGTKLRTMPLHGPSQLQGLLPSYCFCVIKRFLSYVVFCNNTQIPIFLEISFGIWPIHGNRYKGSFEE